MADILLYDKARAAIAECKQVDDVKEFMNRVAAMREYHRQANDRTGEIDMVEIRIRAVRRLGEVVKVERDAGRMASQGTPAPGPGRGNKNAVVASDRVLSLSDMGIGKDLSAQAGKLANMPESTFEREVRDWRTNIEKGTDRVSADLLRASTRRDQQQRAEIRDDPPPLVGQYGVIVIDPPWPMERIERDVAPNQTGFDYGVMSLDAISALDMPSADDCHLFLWTTQKFLPPAMEIAERWGFRYVCLFTWHKPGGFQPFGLPQYNAEHVVYARKGAPKFRDLKEFPLCFTAPRGKHSEKPAAFYDMIERVTNDLHAL